MKVAFSQVFHHILGLICYNWGRPGNEAINNWVYTGRSGNEAIVYTGRPGSEAINNWVYTGRSGNEAINNWVYTG